MRPLNPYGTIGYLDENLTLANQVSLAQKCYVENVDAEFRVYIPSGYDINHKNGIPVKIYAKPHTGTTYSQWSLIAEGTLDATGHILFYSLDEKINELWQYIT